MTIKSNNIILLSKTSFWIGSLISIIFIQKIADNQQRTSNLQQTQQSGMLSEDYYGFPRPQHQPQPLSRARSPKMTRTELSGQKLQGHRSKQKQIYNNALKLEHLKQKYNLLNVNSNSRAVDRPKIISNNHNSLSKENEFDIRRSKSKSKSRKAKLKIRDSTTNNIVSNDAKFRYFHYNDEGGSNEQAEQIRRRVEKRAIQVLEKNMNNILMTPDARETRSMGKLQVNQQLVKQAERELQARRIGRRGYLKQSIQNQSMGMGRNSASNLDIRSSSNSHRRLRKMNASEKEQLSSSAKKLTVNASQNKMEIQQAKDVSHVYSESRFSSEHSEVQVEVEVMKRMPKISKERNLEYSQKQSMLLGTQTIKKYKNQLIPQLSPNEPEHVMSQSIISVNSRKNSPQKQQKIVVVPYQAQNSHHQDNTLTISRVSNNSKLSNKMSNINLEPDNAVPNFADIYKTIPFQSKLHRGDSDSIPNNSNNTNLNSLNNALEVNLMSQPNRILTSSDYQLIKDMEKRALVEQFPNGIQKQREFNKIVYQKSSSSVYGKSDDGSSQQGHGWQSNENTLSKVIKNSSQIMKNKIQNEYQLQSQSQRSSNVLSSLTSAKYLPSESPYQSPTQSHNMNANGKDMPYSSPMLHTHHSSPGTVNMNERATFPPVSVSYQPEPTGLSQTQPPSSPFFKTQSTQSNNLPHQNLQPSSQQNGLANSSSTNLNTFITEGRSLLTPTYNGQPSNIMNNSNSNSISLHVERKGGVYFNDEGSLNISKSEELQQISQTGQQTPFLPSHQQPAHDEQIQFGQTQSKAYKQSREPVSVQQYRQHMQHTITQQNLKQRLQQPPKPILQPPEKYTQAKKQKQTQRQAQREQGSADMMQYKNKPQFVYPQQHAQQSNRQSGQQSIKKTIGQPKIYPTQQTSIQKQYGVLENSEPQFILTAPPAPPRRPTVTYQPNFSLPQPSFDDSEQPQAFNQPIVQPKPTIQPASPKSDIVQSVLAPMPIAEPVSPTAWQSTATPVLPPIPTSMKPIPSSSSSIKPSPVVTPKATSTNAPTLTLTPIIPPLSSSQTKLNNNNTLKAALTPITPTLPALIPIAVPSTNRPSLARIPPSSQLPSIPSIITIPQQVPILPSSSFSTWEQTNAKHELSHPPTLTPLQFSTSQIVPIEQGSSSMISSSNNSHINMNMNINSHGNNKSSGTFIDVDEIDQGHGVSFMKQDNYNNGSNIKYGNHNKNNNQTRDPWQQSSYYPVPSIQNLIPPTTKSIQSYSYTNTFTESSKSPSQFLLSSNLHKWSGEEEKQICSIYSGLGNQSQPLQRLMDKFYQHLSCVNQIADFVAETQRFYADGAQRKSFYPELYLLLMMLYEERGRIIAHLKQGRSCFHLSGREIDEAEISKFSDRQPYKKYVHELEQSNQNLHKILVDFHNYLLSTSPQLMLRSPDSSPSFTPETPSFSPHNHAPSLMGSPSVCLTPSAEITSIIQKLNEELQLLINKIDDNENRKQELNQFLRQNEYEAISMRAWMIMEVVFLVSELKGRRVKKMELSMEVEDFEMYFKQYYSLFKETVLCFI